MGWSWIGWQYWKKIFEMFFWCNRLDQNRLPYFVMILLTKSPGSPKSFQEAPRKLQKISGQKFRNIFVGILDKTDFSLGHSEINWPLDRPYLKKTTREEGSGGQKILILRGHSFWTAPKSVGVSGHAVNVTILTFVKAEESFFKLSFV